MLELNIGFIKLEHHLELCTFLILQILLHRNYTKNIISIKIYLEKYNLSSVYISYFHSALIYVGSSLIGFKPRYIFKVISTNTERVAESSLISLLPCVCHLVLYSLFA